MTVDNPLPRRYYSLIMASERIQRRIEHLLDQIEQEADQQNWQRVIDLAKEVLGFALENVDAKAFLGVAEERLSSAAGTSALPLPKEQAEQANTTSLELRAAMSLARLWQKQGKQTEAQELLAGIYGWFTEGFDTPDLIDAKALLEELS